MSEALMNLIAAICLAAPSPCFQHDNVLQLPIIDIPHHVDVEDLRSFTHQGMTIKIVHAYPAI